MDRLLSAVGPVDRSKSTRARACIWAGIGTSRWLSAAVMPTSCKMESRVPCSLSDSPITRESAFGFFSPQYRR